MLKSLPGPNFSGVQRVKNRIAEIRRLVGDKNVSRGGSTFVEVLEEKERDYEKQAAKEILKNGKSLTGRKGIVNLADHTEESNFALIEKVLERKCRKYGVKESLVKAVMEMESGGNPKAVSKAGAMGLMQLMPSTAKMLGVNNPFDIEENLDGGIRYLKMLLEKYEGNEELALAAYHSGPARVDKYGGVPPYPIVRHYVRTVLALMNKRERS